MGEPQHVGKLSAGFFKAHPSIAIDEFVGVCNDLLLDGLWNEILFRQSKVYGFIGRDSRPDVTLHDLDNGIREPRVAQQARDEQAGLPPLRLHDLRKTSITWLWILGVPLEIASELNVGWTTLNVVKRHYLDMRKHIKRSEREKYADNIPDWFKDGLSEYTEL